MSPLKKTRCRSVAMTHDDQSEAFVVPGPRPEKWRAGVAWNVSGPTLALSHQSSSTMRSAGTPHDWRWDPTPSDVTKGAPSLASARMVGRSR